MVQSGRLIPMVNRNGIAPSRIFFADDIFLFCNGDKRNTDKLLKLLKEYQQSSGQNVSMEKSKFLVGGTTDSRKLQIANNCGMSLSKFPDKYLGVNLIPGNIKSSHVWGSVDLIQSEMPGWMAFPFTVCQYTNGLGKLLECDRIIRNFLWSEDPAKKKLLTVKWEEVNSPLAEGSLGLRSLEDIKKSMLMKLTWKMQNDKDEWAFKLNFKIKMVVGVSHIRNLQYGLVSNGYWMKYLTTQGGLWVMGKASQYGMIYGLQACP
ncbi:uncharacterized protein LOC113278925 [Papaver somniferum]|uniref:uncharacterized protein LOC113278925 n=1 Tax=Papaver somniferum TaxID=3469 RepID=UPI000E6FC9BC|nr:uncharacterized protein LOC113278925 [Papaver somniferum]